MARDGDSESGQNHKAFGASANVGGSKHRDRAHGFTKRAIARRGAPVVLADHSYGCGAVAVTSPAWKVKPSFYLAPIEDHMTPPVAQRKMPALRQHDRR